MLNNESDKGNKKPVTGKLPEDRKPAGDKLKAPKPVDEAKWNADDSEYFMSEENRQPVRYRPHTPDVKPIIK